MAKRSLASITLSGNVGSEPDVQKVGSNDTDLATFSLAVSQGYGERASTGWYRIQMWGGISKLAGYINKGDQIVVTGRPEVEDYERSDGTKGRNVKVNVDQIQLDPRGGRSSGGGGGGGDFSL